MAETATSKPFRIKLPSGTELYGITQTPYVKDGNNIKPTDQNKGSPMYYYTEVPREKWSGPNDLNIQYAAPGTGSPKFYKLQGVYNREGNGKWTSFEAGEELKKEFAKYDAGKSTQISTVVATASQAVSKETGTSASGLSQKLFKPTLPPQTPPPTDTQTGLNEKQQEFIKDEATKIESRNDYDKNKPIVYPITLRVDYQDCIKFSIVKYQQTGLKGFGPGDRDLRRVVINEEGRPGFKGKRDILGTIVLPIPGGIQDSNRVVWSGSEPLYDPQAALGKLFQTAVQGGNVKKTVEEQFQDTNKSELKAAISNKLLEGAINASNLMQRELGVIVNPNLELLFNSPDLRTFGFSFKLSPRSSKEAEVVKKIIRTFKQAMSVKRSTSSFLLQTPHTFAISYIFKNQAHPYLNKFKECALTSCNVNYTPEGTYMSFEDDKNPSMVSYQLDLTFQELEPVYDDDYGNDYDNIGY